MFRFGSPLTLCILLASALLGCGSGGSRYAPGGDGGRLAGTNLAFGATVADASDLALSVNYAISRLGTLAVTDPAFAAPSASYRPGVGSGAIDAATAVPSGVAPDPAYAELPVSREPAGGATNGMSPRTQRGTALDLGALEAAP